MRGRRSRSLPDIPHQRVFEVVDRCWGGVLAERPDAMSASNRSHLQPSYAHYSLETSRYVGPETSVESTHSVTPDTGEGIHFFFFKGGQNWILCPVEKIVPDEKNKLLFIRPKTDNSFSTYPPSKLRPSKNGRESNSRREQNSVPNDVTHTHTHTHTETHDSQK